MGTSEIDRDDRIGYAIADDWFFLLAHIIQVSEIDAVFGELCY